MPKIKRLQYYKRQEAIMSNYSIQLTGKTAFDQKGNKVLVNTHGKAFAIDETIEDLWQQIEGLIHQKEINSPEDLAGEVKTQAPEKEIKTVLSKLQEHQLLSFE